MFGWEIYSLGFFITPEVHVRRVGVFLVTGRHSAVFTIRIFYDLRSDFWHNVVHIFWCGQNPCQLRLCERYSCQMGLVHCYECVQTTLRRRSRLTIILITTAATIAVQSMWRGKILFVYFFHSDIFSLMLSEQIWPSRFRSSITVVELVLSSKGGRNLYIICKAGSNLAVIMVQGRGECY